MRNIIGCERHLGDGDIITQYAGIGVDTLQNRHLVT